MGLPKARGFFQTLSSVPFFPRPPPPLSSSQVLVSGALYEEVRDSAVALPAGLCVKYIGAAPLGGLDGMGIYSLLPGDLAPRTFPDIDLREAGNPPGVPPSRRCRGEALLEVWWPKVHPLALATVPSSSQAHSLNPKCNAWALPSAAVLCIRWCTQHGRGKGGGKEGLEGLVPPPPPSSVWSNNEAILSDRWGGDSGFAPVFCGGFVALPLPPPPPVNCVVRDNRAPDVQQLYWRSFAADDLAFAGA